MSFVVFAALAVGLLVAVPIAAHLLRRGRTEEQEFPPAALVPSMQAVARQRSRLEDRLLLALRAAIVLTLAVLGATPLVKCSRLSLTRHAGASVAMALVLDDSLSMRGVHGGAERWARAKRGAEELLRSAREGDAIAIVLAGKPARLALAATTDLSAARATLDELEATDRSTELGPAVAIARSTLKPLPHTDKRVVVLSDFADAGAGDLAGVWAPLGELTESIDDCGIASAEVRGRRVTATIACTTAAAARDRNLEVVAAEQSAKRAANADAAPSVTPEGGVISSARLAVRAGTQTATLELPALLSGLDVRLGGSDDLVEDDTAPVAPEASALVVGVVTDTELGTVSTGGPTALEQALTALATEAVMRPLSLVPEDAKELSGFAALLLDDPPGLVPEARSAIRTWLEHGGVALAFLGPRAAGAELGSTLEPFARGAVHWESVDGNVDAASAGWLGPEAESLADLAVKGRMRLEASELTDARVLARFTDREPFLVERTLGRGLALTSTLPTSVKHSDLALRAGFLALLDHALAEARRHTGARRTVAGTPWLFPTASSVKISGPTRKIPAFETFRGANGVEQQSFVPVVRGRYTVELDGEAQERVVTLDAEEIAARPRPAQNQEKVRAAGSAAPDVDASPEISLFVLLFVFIELAYRSLIRIRPGRFRHAER